ncbi:DUF5819 family protein [Promicromonospora citrea]|uniref:Uncharacterized protein n=2 Tax=Promicromonospora citrea TaxID=43677 RepID=A0A8H9L399_9MICO|nr:DUF5819 family protein [Promicromonospora citrea]GGM17879.1 hypothetical protein GCM10010102_11980 [Promicromonospora citrea]
MSTAREGPDAVAPVSPRRRVAVLAVWAVLATHLVATLLWTAPGRLTGQPDDEPLSDQPVTSVARRALATWMTPVFDQGWSLFAPEPRHVDHVLRVRGVYAGEDGEPVAGPWIDATAVETRALTGHLLPAATERPARRLAAEARSAYLELPGDARLVALRSAAFPGRGPVPPDAAADPVWAALHADLLDSGAAPEAADRYLAADRALAAYATQVVAATPPDPAGTAAHDSPVLVQTSVARREVVLPGEAEPAPSETVLGARPPLRLPGQDDDAFASAWRRLLGLAGGGAARAGRDGDP